MRQIADEVGVSASTVSQVLNGRGGVSAAVAERVLQAARRLGYRHKHRDRHAADRVLRRIGMVMAGNSSIVARPFYASLLAGAAAECAALDMTISYCPVSDGSGAARLGEAGLDALVLAGYLAPELEAQLAALNLPMVMANNRPSLSSDCVVFDDSEGGRLAARALLRRGHHRLAVLHDPLARGVLGDRLRAFRRAAGVDEVDRVDGVGSAGRATSAAGQRSQDVDGPITVAAFEVPPNGDLPGSGYETAFGIFSAHPSDKNADPSADEPTALFCTSDRIALGALKALWDLRRPVPAAVSVVGFNDFEATAHANPPLTTVHADMELMGRVAVRRLLERAREPQQPPMTVQIGVSLIERDSVGPAPRVPTKESVSGASGMEGASGTNKTSNTGRNVTPNG